MMSDNNHVERDKPEYALRYVVTVVLIIKKLSKVRCVRNKLFGKYTQRRLAFKQRLLYF